VGLALQTPEPAAPAPEPPPQAEAPPEPAPVAAAPDPCAPGQAHTPEQCPALDDDGDGIPNGEDQCPEQAGIPELHGCPAVDTDGDGIPDYLDKCPDQPGVAEYQGWPPPAPSRAEIGAGKIDIEEKVYFDTGKAVIQQRSHALLDDVARLIVANPQVGVIRIEGHTDDRGSAQLNRRLSLARAEAVRGYLVSQGVDAARLQAQGFGPDRPAQPNTTAAGREANRRVEFVILGAGAS
jgi:outer membrane protein OmpA-like peptidoglycan-associated protein